MNEELFGDPWVSLLPTPSIMNFRKNLRQRPRLRSLMDDILAVDGEAFLYNENCLKNLGKIGTQPTIIQLTSRRRCICVSLKPRKIEEPLPYLQSSTLITPTV